MTTENAEQETMARPPQIPTKERFLWGIGGTTDYLIYQTPLAMCQQIYVIALGISPAAVALAQSIPRLLDIVADPIIGHLSDNTRSRFGRRRPWMFCGALLAALISIVMWYPPLSLGTQAANIFIVVMLVLLYTFGYSLFTIPYTAQGYELSTDYIERTHIFKWRQYSYAAIGILTPWIPWLCLTIEGEAQSKVTKGSIGIHWISFVIAGVILLTAAGPIFGAREGGQHQRERKVRFRDAVKYTLRNKAFWPIVAGNFLYKAGMISTGIFFYYLMMYYVSEGDMQKGSQQWGVFCNVINISTFLAMGPIVRLTDRLGKKLRLADVDAL